MGYNTNFRGTMYFNRPIDNKQLVHLLKICGEDYREHPEWDKFRINKDGYLSYIDLEVVYDEEDNAIGLAWSEDEKTYNMVEIICLVINYMKDKFPDFALSGKMDAVCAEYGDIWTIIINPDSGYPQVVDTEPLIPNQIEEVVSKIERLFDIDIDEQKEDLIKILEKFKLGL